MNDDRRLVIHFNNGSTMEFSFPKQVKGSMARVMESIMKVLESDKLAIEANGRLIVIPWASIQHVDLTPLPTALPFGAIRGARLKR
jgi:hypothetical protein